MGGVTLPLPSSWSAVQPGALPESLTPTSPTPPSLTYYTNATPLFLFSLFSLSLSFSLSLINVKPSNNKACILSPPASSVPCICHCALTLPLHQLSGHHHPFTWPQSRNSGPPCQHERLFRGSIRKRKKWGGGLSLTSVFSSFFWPGEERDSIVVYIIHGTHKRKRAIE